MRIVLIHGAPAVGKFTVAQALLDQVPGRLLDNHAPIGFALRLFDFAAPGFWPLVRTVREAALRAAAERGVDILVMTLCYNHPFDLNLLHDIENSVSGAPGGSVLLPVFLYCSDGLADLRVVSPEQVGRGKLATVEARQVFVASNNFKPIPRPECLKLSTSGASPARTADRIRKRFKLDEPKPAEVRGKAIEPEPAC